MAHSRSFARNTAIGSLAIASVAVPTISMAPAANAAEEPIMAEVSGFSNQLSPDSQTTPFVQQTVTTDINLPANFTNNFNLRTQPENGATYTAGKISYTRSGALAYESGTINGTGIAKFTGKTDNTLVEIGATGPGIRVADGTLRQPILVSAGTLHRVFDARVSFSANGEQKVSLPQNIVDAAKAEGIDLAGTTVTLKTSSSKLASSAEKFPAMCWTPSTKVANTVDMSKSKGLVRVGDSFIIPAGVVVEAGQDYKTAKLPATIAFKGDFNGVVLAPELKVIQAGQDQVSTELRGIVGNTSNGATSYSDYTSPVFGSVADTLGWNVSDPTKNAMFGGEVSPMLSSPLVGVAAESEFGMIEAGCAVHSDELDAAHQQLFGYVPRFDQTVESYYSDVTSDSAFAEDILWAAQKGITTGYSDGTFRPQQNISRAAVAAFMYRLAGSPAYVVPKVSPFNDVPTTHPFYKEISWLASQGITTGYTDGTFRPEASVNRDAMAAFFYRFAGKPAYTAPNISSFKDVPASSQFYKEISWLASKGISTGWSDGTFRPSIAIERNAMVTFMHRYDQKH